jgi:hypothetical protein
MMTSSWDCHCHGENDLILGSHSLAERLRANNDVIMGANSLAAKLQRIMASHG